MVDSSGFQGYMEGFSVGYRLSAFEVLGRQTLLDISVLQSTPININSKMIQPFISVKFCNFIQIRNTSLIKLQGKAATVGSTAEAQFCSKELLKQLNFNK